MDASRTNILKAGQRDSRTAGQIVRKRDGMYVFEGFRKNMGSNIFLIYWQIIPDPITITSKLF